jgi:hypothetical protein
MIFQLKVLLVIQIEITKNGAELTALNFAIQKLYYLRNTGDDALVLLLMY